MNCVGLKSALLNIYDTQYKKLLVLSFLLLLACVGVLVHHKITTGDFVEKGVSLKGGLTLTIPAAQADIPQLQHALEARFPRADVGVRSIAEAGELKALIIEASDVTEEQLIAALKDNGFPMRPGTFSSEIMGSSLGQSFYRQTLTALAFAFVFMGIVVFITFRNAVPSMFVILAVISDILSTLAVLDVLGIKLSTAGVAALMMLIGYSVDTDILLTTKVFLRKEGGTVFERTVKCMQTGLLMSLTSFAATTAGYIITQSDIVKQIMLILSIGLLFDIIYTWIQNAGILRWYLEAKHKREGGHHG